MKIADCLRTVVRSQASERSRDETREHCSGGRSVGAQRSSAALHQTWGTQFRGLRAETVQSPGATGAK